MRLFRNITVNIPSMNRIREVVSQQSQHFFDIRAEHLWEQVYNSTAPGICSEPICDHEVIVSLTTYDKRIYEVALTIESIMQGSVKPNRIILWLDNSFKDKPLPVSLQRQVDRGLEIGYDEDLRSYMKLVPTLQRNPESIIITIDDDAIYARDLVENLLRSYQLDKAAIHACRIHEITFQEDGTMALYRNWMWESNGVGESHLFFFTGVGGVLYPPHSLDDEVLNKQVFMDICPTADDVWFKCMALRQGTLVKKAYTHDTKGCDYLLNNAVQDIGLNHTNLKVIDRGIPSKNDIQLQAVLGRYDLYSQIRPQDPSV